MNGQAAEVFHEASATRDFGRACLSNILVFSASFLSFVLQSQIVYELGLSWGGDSETNMELYLILELKPRGFGDGWNF